MSSKRRRRTLHEDSLGAGILGWTETHEHANIVARQLQRMPHIVRWLAGQMHVLKTVLVALLLDSVRRLVRGTACDWKPWKDRQGWQEAYSLTQAIQKIGLLIYITCQMRHPLVCHAAAVLNDNKRVRIKIVSNWMNGRCSHLLWVLSHTSQSKWSRVSKTRCLCVRDPTWMSRPSFLWRSCNDLHKP